MCYSTIKNVEGRHEVKGQPGIHSHQEQTCFLNAHSEPSIYQHVGISSIIDKKILTESIISSRLKISFIIIIIIPILFLSILFSAETVMLARMAENSQNQSIRTSSWTVFST